MNGVKLLKRILSGRVFASYSVGFSDLLLYGKMVDNGIILQTDGSFLSAFLFCGSDLETSTNERLTVVSAHINSAFNLIGNGWLFHVDTIRYVADGYIKEEDCNFSKKLAQLIDEERRFIYNEAGMHYENLYVISFTYKPKVDIGNKIGLFFKKYPDDSSNYEQFLSRYKNKLLEVVELLGMDLDIQMMNSGELLSYISWCITGEKINLQIPKNYGTFLKHFLAPHDLVGGEKPQIGDKHLRVISIMGFPSNSYTGILDKLNYLKFEYRFNTRFILIDQYEGNKIIDKIANLWFQKRISAIDTMKISFSIDSNIKVNQNAESYYSDAKNAMFANDGGDVKFGYYTAVVILTDNNQNLVEENAKEVRNTLRNMGFQSHIERYHSIEGYLGSLPGYAYANIRKWLINTRNVSDLIPSTSVWSGLKNNPCPLYGDNQPPLFYATTTGSTPIRLSLHVGGSGHTLILGPTGSGKSTLLNFIIAQHFRYKNAQVFMFDRHKSSLPLCYGLEGKFVDIAEDGCFQPLAKLEEDIDFEFAAIWLEELCILNGMQNSFSDSHRNAIRRALTLMRNEICEERRTMSFFRYLVHDYDKSVASVLKGFSSENDNQEIIVGNVGIISKIFDASLDVLDNLENNFTVFEMGKVIELGDRIIIPCLRYLIHQINKCIVSNKPTLIVFDESAVFFKHYMFRDKIVNWLKEMRKFNVAIMFATQEFVDLLKYDDLFSSLKSNCVTKIYLPNVQADSSGTKEQYQSMGLNEKQINLISQLLIGEYFYTSSLGSRKFSLSLAPRQITYSFTARNSNSDVQEAINLYTKSKSNFVENWCMYTRGFI